jgi:3-oxoacyl-[acyl-carrier protein] reductase
MENSILDFTGKVAFITGAAGEIGAKTEELFLRQGARVVSADLAFPAPKGARPDFAANPLRVRLDVTRAEDVQRLVELTARERGGIDVVVNAAGVLNIKPFLEITESEWDRTFAVNVKGMFLVCQAALRKMISQKRGCFVNFASISGKVGGVLAGADYSASKAAVICLTKSLAKAGAPYGIRANSVAPGAVYSPMLDLYYREHAEEMRQSEKSHPLGRFGRPEEVASAVLFLASDQASYITGACMDINGGSRMD